MRDRYGRTTFGQSLLLARRLVEAGTRVVEVIWPKVANSDAHSFDGVSRWQNVESAQDYVARSERGRTVRSGESSPDRGEEKFFVGLRLSEGVHADEADWLRFGPAFERFLSAGVLERANGNLRLTPRGVMVSNEVFQEFITA